MLLRMRNRALQFFLIPVMLLAACQQVEQRGNYYSPYSTRVPQHPIRQTAIQSARDSASPVSRVGIVPPSPLPRPGTAAPQPNCAAVCVIDPRTGKFLYEYNAYTRRQVASTQKLVTALCVLDAGNLGKMVTIAPEDETAPPIKLALKPGTKYRKADLLRAMLTGSYNDVALTLARDTAGSVSAFARRMNARARRMGMRSSHFVNPNGLPAAQYSTAHDMALAACYAYSNPIIRRFVNVPEYQFRMADGRLRTIKSTNKLLKQYSWVQGMKTGYTNAAGKCLISCGSRNGHSVIVVVLGSTNAKVWDESLKYLRWALGIPA